MRTRLACALALGLGIAAPAVAQYGAPYGTFVPDPAAPAPPIPPIDPAANDGAALPISTYAKPGRMWFNAEYILWWVRDQNSPPLIQTVPDSLVNTNPLPAGATSTLFPVKNINYSPFNGVRLYGGVWLNSASTIGIDGSAFWLQQNNRTASFSSSGSPILGETYTSTNTGAVTTLYFSSPDPVNGYNGSISAKSEVSRVFGADANLRWNGYAYFADNTDYLYGFRYFDFREQLDMDTHSNFKDGSRLAVVDHFATTNQFYGAQIGIDSRLAIWRGFSIEGIFKFALGSVHQTANISGFNTITTPAGASSTQAGGLYAQPSNIGTYSQNRLGTIPEFTFNMSYNFTDSFAMYFGYNILWINDVARPASDIDTNINDAKIRYIAGTTPGNAPNPIFSFHDQSMWVQGLNFGLRFQY